MPRKTKIVLGSWGDTIKLVLRSYIKNENSAAFSHDISLICHCEENVPDGCSDVQTMTCEVQNCYVPLEALLSSLGAT